MKDQLPLELEAPPRLQRQGQLRSFHVSLPGGHASVPEALEGERKAQRQESKVLAMFMLFPASRATPSQVAAIFPQWPLTSVRRALTNLTKRGLLQHHKTDRRPGPYGSKESTWSLA